MGIQIQSRAVTRFEAETRSLFLAKEAGPQAGSLSPAWREAVEQLTYSTNDAIATEALRLAILAEVRS